MHQRPRELLSLARLIMQLRERLNQAKLRHKDYRNRLVRHQGQIRLLRLAQSIRESRLLFSQTSGPENRLLVLPREIRSLRRSDQRTQVLRSQLLPAFPV